MLPTCGFVQGASSAEHKGSKADEEECRAWDGADCMQPSVCSLKSAIIAALEMQNKITACVSDSSLPQSQSESFWGSSKQH